MMNLKNGLKKFTESCKNAFNEDSKNNPMDVDIAPHAPQRNNAAQNTLSSYNKWWQIKNAEYYRDVLPVYFDYIFAENSAYSSRNFEDAFGNAVSQFFESYGGWEIVRTYPEIRVCFLCVNVISIKEKWNRRDSKLRDALLNELRRGYVQYARTKQYLLDGCFKVVVERIWLVDDKLVLELPTSEFYFNYSHLCSILVPDAYRRFCNQLDRETIL